MEKIAMKPPQYPRPAQEKMCPCPSCLLCCCRFTPGLEDNVGICVNSEEGECTCERVDWHLDPLPTHDPAWDEFAEMAQYLRELVWLSLPMPAEYFIPPHIRKENQMNCRGGSRRWLPSKPQIKIILDKFDFDKVAATMTLLGWRWLGANQSPTPDEIKEQAVRLLNIVVDENVRSATTGGLLVTRSPEGQLKLMFVLESAEDYFALEDARSKEADNAE